jgi:hypothetical protein
VALKRNDGMCLVQRWVEGLMTKFVLGGRAQDKARALRLLSGSDKGAVPRNPGSIVTLAELIEQLPCGVCQ